MQSQVGTPIDVEYDAKKVLHLVDESVAMLSSTKESRLGSATVHNSHSIGSDEERQSISSHPTVKDGIAVTVQHSDAESPDDDDASP